MNRTDKDKKKERKEKERRWREYQTRDKKKKIGVTRSFNRIYVFSKYAASVRCVGGYRRGLVHEWRQRYIYIYEKRKGKTHTKNQETFSTRRETHDRRPRHRHSGEVVTRGKPTDHFQFDLHGCGTTINSPITNRVLKFNRAESWPLACTFLANRLTLSPEIRHRLYLWRHIFIFCSILSSISHFPINRLNNNPFPLPPEWENDPFDWATTRILLGSPSPFCYSLSIYLPVHLMFSFSSLSFISISLLFSDAKPREPKRNCRIEFLARSNTTK